MRPSPPRYQAIVEQKPVETLDEVYSGMAATGWSRSFIPNYAVLEQPVRAFVMKKLGTGKKSRRRAKRIRLKDCAEWDNYLQRSYDKLRYSLVQSIKRSYRDYDKVSCLMWDASKFAWSYTITQVNPEELAKPWHKQQHEILVTRSGIFKGSQKHWHPGCKEAYPPTRALEVDSEFLTGRHPFIAAGDHRNITYIMNQKRRPAVLRKPAHDRLNRACLKWMHANFQIYTLSLIHI